MNSIKVVRILGIFKVWRVSLRVMLIMALLSGVTVTTASAAVSFGEIDVGDTYYINNIFSDNDLVVVKRVNRARGLVKVQYASGGVDWVAPSKLYTRTAARNADTEEAIVGTALIAGALWAIFDPAGFEHAMSNKNSSRSSSRQSKQKKYSEAKQRSKSAVNITAVPFSPVVEGVWANQGKDWKDRSETLLNNQLGKSISIESVRTKRIPFYSNASRKVVLAEVVQSGHKGAYYIIAVAGGNTKVILDGKGTSIHEINRLLGFSIDTAKEAESYLKFFTSAISAGDGVFVVLEPNADYLPKQVLKKIGVKPIQVSRNKKEGWTIFADVIYGNNVFGAEFLVQRNGNVEMINDSFKQDLSFKYRVAMDGHRRLYVSQ